MNVNEEFVQRVRDELGETMNPHYVAKILQNSTPELLRWIQTNLVYIGPSVNESIQIAESAPEQKLRESPFPLGITLLEGNFKFILFVLKEISSRVNAIEHST